MLRDITIGRYINKESLLHHADARTKILAALAFSLAVILCGRLSQLAVGAVFTIIAIAVSKIPAKYCLKGLKPLWWFILFTVIIKLFTAKGYIIWQWKVFHISYEGIISAAATAMKFILLVMGTSLLTLTTRPIALTDGLARLMKPLRRLHIPVDDVAVMISVTLRTIPSFADEADKLMKAQKSRSAGFESNSITSKIDALLPIAVPLLAGVFKKAGELSLAMDIRCYGKGLRVPRRCSKFSMVDAAIAAVFAVFCIFLIFIENIH